MIAETFHGESFRAAQRRWRWACATAFVLLLVVACGILWPRHAVTVESETAEAIPTVPAKGRYLAARKLAVLENEAISESSGLAISHRWNGIFWTHNDSGDRARILAFDRHGGHWGDYLVPGAEAIDWEDMASFQDGDQCYLLLADVGDNPRRRRSCQLYLVEEPRSEDAEARLRMRIDFRYEDGPRNCEAIAIDATTRTIHLVGKQTSLHCPVYELTLPAEPPPQPLVARRIAQLFLPVTTAMDISPDGRRAVILTYGHAYEYERSGEESWATAYTRRPREITMPARRQGESICYGADGYTLYLTSEGLPTPLWEVPFETNLTGAPADQPGGTSP